MRRTILTALIAFVAGIGVGLGSYALFLDAPAKTGSGVYCYNPDPLDPLTTRCVPTGR